MVYLFIGIFILFLILYGLNKITSSDPKEVMNYGKYIFVAVVVALTLFLLMRGGFQLIWVGLLALLPWVGRFRLLASIYQAYRRFRGSQNNSGPNQNQDQNQDRAENQGDKAKASMNLTRPQALELLGLKEGASEDDIKEAHRKLMMIHHPDHGGNVEMASLLNRAKDYLLEG